MAWIKDAPGMREPISDSQLVKCSKVGIATTIARHEQQRARDRKRAMESDYVGKKGWAWERTTYRLEVVKARM